MMRSTIFAIVLALAKCQSGQAICRLDRYEEYSDPDCTKPQQRVPESMYPDFVRRINEILNEDSCQVWNETMSPYVKFKMTCLTSEAAKIEQFNHQNEDNECKYPYPTYSTKPSYIAENGKCVETSPNMYTKFFISSTTGRFEQSGESFEIPDFNKQAKPDAGQNTKEAITDRSTMANVCMTTNFEIFNDDKCTQPAELPAEWRDFLLYLGNTEIQSPECVYSDRKNEKGVKVRAYCEDLGTLTSRTYSAYDEDPQCLRPYPSDAVNYTSWTAKSGECIKVGNLYSRIEINKYDGRKFEWNPEWDKLMDQLYPSDESNYPGQKGEKGEKGQSQAFSFEGDGYSMNVEMQNNPGGQSVMTEAKFDNYFLYSIDTMGEDGFGTPPCGPDAKYDMCKEKVYSQETCCTHVVMMDRNGNQQQSFYRCMNQQVVDASFSFEIDGMSMSMMCSGGDGDMMSAAANINGFALLASIISLITISGF